MTNKQNFIDKSNIVHGNKYNYSKVCYVNNKTKVEIICDSHGSFYQRPDGHLNGQGCNPCGILRRVEKRTIPLKDFILRSKELHGDKYDYNCSSDYIGIKYKVSIKCNTCKNIFRQMADSHTRGQGCPICANNQTYTTDEFIRKSTRIHGNKYNYDNVKYTRTSEKVQITCLRCRNTFYQRANDHLNGSGCGSCNKKDGQSYKKLNTSIFVDRSRLIHGNVYDYSKSDYKYCQLKVEIICNSCKSTFFQEPLHHMNGHGCPNCAKNKYTSKLEKDFLNHLNIPDELSNRQVGIGEFVVDALVDNTVYEFLGDFWHGNPDKYKSSDVNVVVGKTFGMLYNNTLLRFKKLKSSGFEVKYIWESDWNQFKIGNGGLEIKDFNLYD